MKRTVENPWKIISSKVVYQSRFIKVVEDKVITPEGKSGVHNLIFGGSASIGGVSIAAVNESKEIYLVKQYRYAYQGYTLELVAGGQKENETPIRAAQKELSEEAGLVAKKWTKYNEVWAATESIRLKIHMFLAQDLNPSPENFMGENKMKIVKVPLKEAVALVMMGKIPLASSALGILMVNNILEI